MAQSALQNSLFCVSIKNFGISMMIIRFSITVNTTVLLRFKSAIIGDKIRLDIEYWHSVIYTHKLKQKSGLELKQLVDLSMVSCSST